MTTEINFHYYDAGWQDLTDYVTGLHIEETGIKRVSTATVNLEGARSIFNDYLASPYKLVRIRQNHSGWQNIFYGYVDNPQLKTIAGVITERSKISLDCFSFSARIMSDYITFDYYALQSAITPLADANAWTFRRVIEDMLAYPDSGYAIEFDVEAANDPDGIDHIVDASASWDRQTIFEAIRTICDRIGYDGYYYLASESGTPTIKLYPFNKTSSATISGPFVKEPEYVYGSLQNIGNIILVWGGIDGGIPSDGDRWTEYAASKYDPVIWTATCTGTSPTITDEDNTVFNGVGLRANNKCVKVSTTGSTNDTMTTIFNIANTEVSHIDAVNRITSLMVNMKLFGDYSYYQRAISFLLTDNNGNQISYAAKKSSEAVVWETGAEQNFVLPLGLNQQIEEYESQTYNKWHYYTGTSFNWENIVNFQIITKWNYYTVPTDLVWGHYLDGLMFIGGMKIDPFEHPDLNPPAIDPDSINSYGVHLFPYEDSTITSFEQAQAEGARLLNNLKNPMPTLACTKKDYATLLYPSNVVYVNSVYYRIDNIVYDWQASNKSMYTAFNLVNKTSPLPPIWTEENMMRYFIK